MKQDKFNWLMYDLALLCLGVLIGMMIIVLFGK